MKTFLATSTILVMLAGFLIATPQGRELWQQKPVISASAEEIMELMTPERAEEFAGQLAVLRHGPDLDAPAMAYLGRFTTAEDTDVRDYANARALGDWLPDAWNAADLSGLDATQAAGFLTAVDTALLGVVPEDMQSSFDTNRNQLIADVESGRIAFGPAIGLFAFGDITASDLTNVIAAGLD